MKLISLDRLFSELYSAFPPASEVNEADIIEWAGKAIEFIGSTGVCKEVVTVQKVENFTCELPKHLNAILQIARYHGAVESSEVTVEEEGEEEEETTVNYVPIDGDGYPLCEYNLAYYRPGFTIDVDYGNFVSSSFYRSQFTPVRLSTNTMFSGLVCKNMIPEFENISCKDEYKLISDCTARMSFESGTVVIAYLKYNVDEHTGYPMMLDDPSYTEAVKRFIMYRVAERKYYTGVEGWERKMVDAEDKWHWYCKQAKNKMIKLMTIDDYQNFTDGRNYIFPNRNIYSGFFSRLNHPEGKKFNDPAKRNRQL